jgi:hypothetical protein
LGIILAKQGYTVILDAKYDKQSLREEAIAQAKQNQLPLQIVYCSAPLDVVEERLIKRTGDIADATVDLLTSQVKQTEPFTGVELSYVKTWDTTQPPQTQLEQVIRNS